MKLACCSVLATSDTLLRRAPIICAIDSCVRTSLSLPDRSRVCNRHQHRPQRRTLIGGRPKAIEIKRRGDAGHQHHRAVQRGGVAEGGERTEDAVAADQRDLNVLSLGEFYDQGDDPFMRQVGALERFVDFNQHGFLDEIDGSQMRPDRFEIVSGQRRQKSIG